MWDCSSHFAQNGEAEIAMKWRDAVQAAIMHGPLPPDVTLDAPHWWQPGMPLLPPADHRAPVPLKRKRVTSAEPKTDPTKRAPTRRSCGSRTSTLIKRVSMARHSLTTFAGRSSWCRSSADGMTAAHVTLAADRPWNCHHSPFRVLPTSLMPWQPGSVSASPLGSTSTAVCCASSTSNSSPKKDLRGSFFAACSSHGSSRRLAPAAGRARLTLPESANFCSCVFLCDRFGISQDRIWNLDETAVRIVPTGERGWTRRSEAAHVFASRAFVTVTLAANMRGGMWTQIVYEEKSDRVHPHGPAFPCQLVSHSSTHWITQDAFLDMIDAMDADMHARPGDAELTPWLLVLDCAPQHIAAEFRSIMRDTRPHIKLCYVQRNFTGCAQPLDRACMRAFKNSIRQEVAKHFAEFFLEAESNFEHVNLDSSTVVLRQLLLSFVHTAAQNADSPQHRAAGWRFIDWNEVEQRELLAEAKRRTVSTRHSRGA